MASEPATAQDVHRKRLGQYFSGLPLAKLLAALADASGARTIVDPMAGSGDMLEACMCLGAQPASLVGIELDAPVAARCRQRLGSSAALVTGNTFESTTWAGLPDAYELVITNPPYVRYQLGSKQSGSTVEVPGAAGVRQALIESIEGLSHLSTPERGAFLACAADYSGLSDLAVPSWLLCAARVLVGGRLAMVVPDTWLTRDYASPVLYVLRRFFEVEYVVSDEDVAWFDDALVRTTLVVARRVPDKGGALGLGGHLRVNLTSAAGSTGSLVGGAFDTRDPELTFAQWACAARAQRATADAPVAAAWSDEADLTRALLGAGRRYAWIASEVGGERGVTPPELILKAIGPVESPLVELEQLDWHAGQGLRTGANDFFYLDRVEGGYSSSLLPNKVLRLPEDTVLPVLRRQAELPKSGSRLLGSSRGRVLVLPPRATLSADLQRLVAAAEAKTYHRHGREVPLPQLSAVRTNVRAAPERAETRLWYQLPDLTSRHRGELVIARVNGAGPTAYWNRDGALVIDANFTTLWPDAVTKLPPLAMLALFSSVWVRAHVECSGTVMAGGALKLEATHVRRLAIPRLPASSVSELVALGEDLATGSSADREKAGLRIDQLVLDVVTPQRAANSIDQLHELIRRAQGRRSARAVSTEHV